MFFKLPVQKIIKTILNKRLNTETNKETQINSRMLKFLFIERCFKEIKVENTYNSHNTS